MEKQNSVKSLDFLDSIDEKKNKIFDVIYLFLAFWLILTPVTSSLLNLMGSPVEVITQFVMIGIFFGVVWLVEFSMKITKLKLKKLTLFEYLGLALVLMFVLQILFNKVYGFTGVLFYVSYFLTFCLFFKVDKKYYKRLMYVLIIELSVDSILGIIDCKNEIIPGFDGLPYSLQFINPNYSACVVLGAILAAVYYFVNENKLVDKLITGICFIVLNIFLFINGCFAAEFALFAAELALIIYFWIKNKKFPLWLVIAFLITFVTSFFRAHGYSSSNTVFIIELLGRIDVNIGTSFMDTALNIIDSFTSFFKDLFVGDVAGADKKQQIIIALKEDPTLIDSRAQVMKNALNAINSSAGAFLFGKGVGFAEMAPFMRVHNFFVYLWLEFGFIFMLTFVAWLISLVVMFIKSKNKSNHIVHLVIMFAYLISYYFGMIDFSFTFFLMYLAILYKMLMEDIKENVNKKQD